MSRNINLMESDVDYYWTKICGTHFLSGKPSALFDPTNPEAPSVNLGLNLTKMENTLPQQPIKRRKGRPRKVKVDEQEEKSVVEASGSPPKYRPGWPLRFKKARDGRVIFGKNVNRKRVYLPDGWKCYATRRLTGIHKGIFDIVYVTPNGERLRSRNEVYRWTKREQVELDPRKFLFERGLDVLFREENAKSIIFRNAGPRRKKKQEKSAEEQDEFTTFISTRGRELIGEGDDETEGSSKMSDEQSEEEFDLPDKNPIADGLPVGKQTASDLSVRKSTADDLPVGKQTVGDSPVGKQIANTPRKKNVEVARPKRIIDTLDCLKSPYFSFKNEIPVKPVSILATDVGKWIPPRSPYSLIQEDLYHNPWQLLIATIFLNCTTGKLAIPIIHEFLARWPTPHEACSASLFDIQEVVDLLGLGRTRAATIIRFSHEFLTIDWKKPTELFGIGKYGNDSYKVFCLGQWRGVESDDKYLNLYINWMHNVFSSRPTRPCTTESPDLYL